MANCNFVGCLRCVDGYRILTMCYYKDYTEKVFQDVFRKKMKGLCSKLTLQVHYATNGRKHEQEKS